MSGTCCGLPDTIKGRARLWEEHTRTCTECKRRCWTDKDGMFNTDPRGLVCDVCIARPYHIERNRQMRVAAGLRGQRRAAELKQQRAEAAAEASAETPAERDARLRAVWGSAYQPEADLTEDLDEYDDCDDYDDDAPW